MANRRCRLNLSVQPRKHVIGGEPHFVKAANTLDALMRAQNALSGPPPTGRFDLPPAYFATFKGCRDSKMKGSKFFKHARKQLRHSPINSFRFCVIRRKEPTVKYSLRELNFVMTIAAQAPILPDWGHRFHVHGSFRHLDAPIALQSVNPFFTFQPLPGRPLAAFAGFRAIQLADGWWVVTALIGKLPLRQSRFSHARHAIAHAVCCGAENSFAKYYININPSRAVRRAFWAFENSLEQHWRDVVGAHSSEEDLSESEEEIEVLDSGTITAADRVHRSVMEETQYVHADRHKEHDSNTSAARKANSLRHQRIRSLQYRTTKTVTSVIVERTVLPTKTKKALTEISTATAIATATSL